MFDTKSIIQALVNDPDAYNPGVVIADAVSKALWPWTPKKIDLAVVMDMQYDKLLVEPWGFPMFAYPMDPFYRMRLDPDEMAHKAAQAAFKFYRYRPALPVDDHIVLGEN